MTTAIYSEALQNSFAPSPDFQVYDEPLEQRPRKWRGEKGQDETVDDHAVSDDISPPDFQAVEDFVGQEPASTVADVQPEVEQEPLRALYFIRIPRPPFDAKPLDKLDIQFQEQLNKLKMLNSKLSVKRGELNAIGKQMSDARGLRDGCGPEYKEKNDRLREYKSHRGEYLKKIAEIKYVMKGLDVRTEEALDQRINEIEHRIQHEGLPLSEEKRLVKEIAKLKGQRDKVREFERQVGNLEELEQEASKLKAVIAELEGDFNLLKGERSQAQTILEELKTKFDAIKKDLLELEEERRDTEAQKNSIEEQRRAIRQENNANMQDFRDNRSFSLQIRDMVAEGRIQEAKELCIEQTERMMQRLNNDAEFRKDYLRQWRSQRTYLVSELLPHSGNAPAPVQKKNGPQGRGAGAPKPLPKPQGAEKAKAIIAAALATADAELSGRRPRGSDADDELDDVPSEPETKEVAHKAAPEPPKPKPIPQPRVLAVAPPKPRSEPLAPPTKEEEEFVPPVSKEPEQKATEEELKEKIREEQRQRAAEAELRKRRKQEKQQQKKEKAIERQQAKKQPAETKAPVHTAVVETPSAEEDAEEKVEVPQEEETEVVAAKPVAEKAFKPSARTRDMTPAIKRPRKNKNKLQSKVQKYWSMYSQWIVLAGVLLVTLIMMIAYAYYM